MQAAAVTSFAAAAAPDASALPAMPNFSALFSGRKLLRRGLLQVILNPGDLLGLTTDQAKGSTPSVADANRLNAQLGLQVRAPSVVCAPHGARVRSCQHVHPVAPLDCSLDLLRVSLLVFLCKVQRVTLEDS